MVSPDSRAITVRVPQEVLLIQEALKALILQIAAHMGRTLTTLHNTGLHTHRVVNSQLRVNTANTVAAQVAGNTAVVDNRINRWEASISPPEECLADPLVLTLEDQTTLIMDQAVVDRL